MDNGDQVRSREELTVLDHALVGPELAATFLSIVVGSGNALFAFQYLCQLIADLEVVEPATGLRFTFESAKLLAD